MTRVLEEVEWSQWLLRSCGVRPQNQLQILSNLPVSKMSGQNIFLSNGTCYTGPGQKLYESFIPCGNAAFGHITCCGAGDNCLANDACWGIHGTGTGSYLTYMAGCTDPEYKDPSCPKKIIGE